MTLFELTGFQRDLLYVIAGEGRPSGQQIKDRIETDTGTEVTHGRLYPNLDTLVNNDYVEKGQIDRRTNYYTLSEKGRDAIGSRRQWEDSYLPEEL
ncbi:PadR family transcriptional regulator [Halomarina ordinaria]|uniref:PadR family transcriptional regulator n=1 Tax=Halomarina ordinaria TaxID=3033939 RepID=A0ABD5U9X9_9EURY|nr:PadR family transcriptional regulator [Halomarina sp. PSRA2]